MNNAELAAEIEEAFPGSASALFDVFIEANPDLSLVEAVAGLEVVVPAYMAWCARNGHRPEELVHDYTLRALAEFGRSRSPTVHPLELQVQLLRKATRGGHTFLGLVP